MSRAVVRSEVKHVSATQMETFVDCNRKWFFAYPLGLRPPQTEAQGEGERIHKQFEDYYRLDTPPTKPGVVNLLADPWTPSRTAPVLIEHPNSYQLGLSISGVPVKGRIDLLDHTDPKHPRIWDWKSCKSFYYIKTADELETNLQLTVYGLWAFDQWPEAAYVTYHHGYVLKGDVPKSAPGYRIIRTEPLSRGYVQDLKPHLETIVEDMKVVATKTDPADVPFQSAACDKFGGCPYRDRCPAWVGPSSSFLPPDEPGDESAMTMTRKLEARKLAQGINPPDAARPDAPPATAIEAPSPAAISSTVPGLHLYVDCQPVKGEQTWTRLEDHIAERVPGVLKELADRESKPEYATLPDVREVPYGMGTTALVSSFRRNPPAGLVVATSAGLSGTVVEALLAGAAFVVRPTRPTR